MNRDSMKKLMDLIDDPEFKDTMNRVEENLDRVSRAKDRRQNPDDEKVRVKNIRSSLSPALKEKADRSSDGLALILTGGGAKGSYQAGALKALGERKEDGLPGITGLAGTSAGALNAAMYAGGGAALPEQMWKRLDESRIVGKDGFFSPSEENDRYLEDMIRQSGILSAINMEGPLTVATAFDTDSGYPKDFILNDRTDEEKLRCLMASAAFPIAFREQKIGSKAYIDGGIPVFGSNMPIAPLYHLGFRRFLVIHCSSIKEAAEWIHLHKMGARANQEKYYNGAAFVHIFPGRDLGGLMDGTVNFSPSFLHSCIDLGYEDLKMKIQDLDVLKEEVDHLDEVHFADGKRYRSYLSMLEDHSS